MKVEIPECARCCCCFPLRYGLLVWVYLKLVCIGIVICSYVDIIATAIIDNRFDKDNLAISVIIILITAFSFIDLVFHLIFIIGAHKKNVTIMRLFYKEIIFGLVFYIFSFIYILAAYLSTHAFVMVILTFQLWCIFLLMICSQVYLIILVKSEVRKLERSSNYQFSNPTTIEDEQSVDPVIVA